ncbi:MAG: hypothetical protein H6735_11050 [Alphaproteobacteria bacterium]|nr:hypothetical protein [Alphaproteobacteria bacterium]
MIKEVRRRTDAPLHVCVDALRTTDTVDEAVARISATWVPDPPENDVKWDHLRVLAAMVTDLAYAAAEQSGHPVPESVVPPWEFGPGLLSPTEADLLEAALFLLDWWRDVHLLFLRRKDHQKGAGIDYRPHLAPRVAPLIQLFERLQCDRLVQYLEHMRALTEVTARPETAVVHEIVECARRIGATRHDHAEDVLIWAAKHIDSIRPDVAAYVDSLRPEDRRPG